MPSYRRGGKPRGRAQDPHSEFGCTLPQATANTNSSARRDSPEEFHDQIGSEAPTPSGQQTPRPDLADKRLPGINSSYFGQVGSGPSQASPLRNEHISTIPDVDSGVVQYPAKHVRENSKSRRSSASSGSMVMVERGLGQDTTPPLQPGEPRPKTDQIDQPDAARLPPTPISSASSFLQKDSETAENGKPLVESGINSVTQALRNFVLPKSSTSVKARRHQSLPVSSLATNSVSAAHISNPTSSPHSPTTRTHDASPPNNDKPNVSKSFKELSKLTSNAATGSREKSTPPMTPRTLSHEGADKRSPLSNTTTSSPLSGTAVDGDSAPRLNSKRAPALPTYGPRGKLVIKIAEGRNLKPSVDPYVVCQFEWNESVTSGARHDAMDLDDDQKKRPAAKLSTIPMKRTDSDTGRPMAIPMRSRQTSSNGLSEAEARQATKVTNPHWDHEATL